MTDAYSLEGRVALITGGGGGIGSATARLMHARGAKVAVADINAATAKAVAAEIGGLAILVDIADEQATIEMVERTAAHFGRLDILHNNAIYNDPAGPADTDVEVMDTGLWDHTFAVGVRAPMVATRQAIGHMQAAGGGAIVNTLSIVGLSGSPLHCAYSAAKAALLQLTRSVAVSHGRRGIRCNAVAPGLTLHPAALAAVPPGVLDGARAETSLSRLGEPDDIAQAVAFLASDAARHMTGQVLTVDGGLTAHLPGAGPRDASA